VPDEYLSGNPARLPAGYKTPDEFKQHENPIPKAVRRAAEKANGLVCALPRRVCSEPPSPSIPPDDRDAAALRAEVKQHQREAARLQGIIDGLQRQADAHARAVLDKREQARVNEAAQTVVSLAPRSQAARRKPWGKLRGAAAPSAREIERSADPDAVEREARARTKAEHTRSATQGRVRRGEQTQAKASAMYQTVKAECEAGGRKTNKGEIADTIADRLKISARTVRKYIPK
jgi:hypothetical protein